MTLRRTLSSALLYTLAFNLTFFVQELFLVVPKAFTPGLHPRLFHNNHTWEGASPLAALFQGTGVLATCVSGGLSLWLLTRRAWHPAVQLFLAWLAFSGFYMALPQVVLGTVSSRSDVGMALAYLGLGSGARIVAALTALLLMPLVAIPLARAFLGSAGEAVPVTSVRARARLALEIVTLPALLAIPLIVPFRVPRETIEVVVVPAVVSILGALWVQAAACGTRGRAATAAATARGAPSIVWPITLPLAAVAALLALFQLVLRHGIAFG